MIGYFTKDETLLSIVRVTLPLAPESPLYVYIPVSRTVIRLATTVSLLSLLI